MLTCLQLCRRRAARFMRWLPISGPKMSVIASWTFLRRLFWRASWIKALLIWTIVKASAAWPFLIYCGCSWLLLGLCAWQSQLPLRSGRGDLSSEFSNSAFLATGSGNTLGRRWCIPIITPRFVLSFVTRACLLLMFVWDRLVRFIMS